MCIRDRAHVLALDALRKGQGTSVYNMGNGSGYSVLQVIQASEKITGKKISYSFAPKRAGDPAVLVAGSQKIIKELGWKPQFAELETIIETAWRWHQAHPNGYGGF